ncbi:hypothetical protein [Myroides sp. DF42-4-2]|uniref:hypothetical protein n=1 Tax=Myroides sp. DF42-4-2 TaxID=2746726 RepID=UPI0025791B69|nr:hypothetical protein [Myroides sp. DF42-4-2]MDM1409024.1 hypothetical protein [Myroides sp. DF42-4-2]
MKKILIGVIFAFALVSCETEDAREEIRRRKLGDKMYKLSAAEIEYSGDMRKYGGYRIIFKAL